MKNCPLCGHEYYDEAKWCPECEYDFPAGAPQPPPDRDEIVAALERIAAGESPAGAAAAVAERLDALYREAGDDPNALWKLSVEHLRSAREYELALELKDPWTRAVERFRKEQLRSQEEKGDHDRQALEVLKSVGECPVCHEDVKVSIVHCKKCHTPHHRKCWEYAGKCSTYSCGESAFIE